MHNLLKILFNSTYKIPVTVDYVRQYLTKSFEELKEVSASTISRTLKHRWGVSCKKLSKANPKIFNEEKYRQILQSAALLQKLRNSNIEMIYLDEFSFDPRKPSSMDGAKRTQRNLLVDFLKWRLCHSSLDFLKNNFMECLENKEQSTLMFLNIISKAWLSSWIQQIIVCMIQH